jgi:Na+-driven multidrug efflux pump
VREACNKGILLNSIVMLIVTVLVHIDPTFMVAAFTDEAEVIAVGADFLQIVSFNFICQGIVFSCSGVFQGLGNTKPALLSSAFRLALFIPIALVLAAQPDFVESHIWYASVIAVFSQAGLSYWLVQRELRIKLKPQPVEMQVVAS